MQTVKVAAIQVLPINAISDTKNVEKALSLLNDAAKQGAQVVSFPEKITEYT
jgi:predicted amidohydrolase